MIQANELRIGNAINLQGKPINVNLSTLERLLFPEMDKFKKYRNQYTPIELTEEILLKCGFYKSFKNQYEHTKHYFELVKEKEGFIVGVNCFEYTHGKHFMYLHTLQNIFYFTTNEELNVKL